MSVRGEGMEGMVGEGYLGIGLADFWMAFTIGWLLLVRGVAGNGGKEEGKEGEEGKEDGKGECNGGGEGAEWDSKGGGKSGEAVSDI